MASLTDFMDCVTTQDTRRRIQAHSELVPFLSDPRSSLECEDYELDTLIEGLTAWVKSSNFKIQIKTKDKLYIDEDVKPRTARRVRGYMEALETLHADDDNVKRNRTHR
ncbi:CLIP-associating protein 1 [Elysia marginata]|uniref:CLIP-associating protein 1 n=1 Tax=Elysia marginata TaxID=1093978 RepID=A0AAV4IF69_9GAST|nr:CLIP-associating protein 1 [Elysia marginata]